MHALVRFQLPDGTVRTLGPGDIIGRLWSSALFLDDARVSEAHALISMRGDELRLLALRGRFTVDDRPVLEAALAVGQRIALARGLELVVAEVVIPDEVLGIAGEGLAPQVLLGVASLQLSPQPALLPGHVDDAEAWFWSTGGGESGEGWHYRLRTAENQQGLAAPLEPGDRFVVRGRTFRAVAVPLRQAAGAATVADQGLLEPITLTVRYATAQIERGGQLILTLDGVAARVLTELALVEGLAPWGTIAGEIWRKEKDIAALRHRWDAVITRLRRRLREARVRADLVRADGLGNVSLSLEPQDRLIVQD